MAEERDFWKEIAVAERLIAIAHSAGKTQDEGELWLGLGTCYYFLDLMEEAVSAFEQAIPVLATWVICSQKGPRLLAEEHFLAKTLAMRVSSIRSMLQRSAGHTPNS